MLLALAAVAQLSAAVPLTDRSSWFTDKDITAGMLESDGFFYNVFRLTIDPSGRPVDCKIIQKSGISVFDETTCRLAKRRARFEPARRDGAAAYGVYMSFVRLGASSSGPPSMPDVALSPNIELRVDRLPPGAGAPVTVSIIYARDSVRQPAACRGERETDNAALVELACDRARQDQLGVPVTDKRGQAVESVQRAQIRFTTK